MTIDLIISGYVTIRIDFYSNLQHAGCFSTKNNNEYFIDISNMNANIQTQKIC